MALVFGGFKESTFRFSKQFEPSVYAHIPGEGLPLFETSGESSTWGSKGSESLGIRKTGAID
jgi:hypothetical protein